MVEILHGSKFPPPTRTKKIQKNTPWGSKCVSICVSVWLPLGGFPDSSKMHLMGQGVIRERLHFFNQSKNACLPNYNKTDWVFDIPDVYNDCKLSSSECAALGAKPAHSFSKTVDGMRQLTVTCKPGKRADGLPEWVWWVGHICRSFMLAPIDLIFQMKLVR